MYPYEDLQAAYNDDETQGAHINQTQEHDSWVAAMQQEGTLAPGEGASSAAGSSSSFPYDDNRQRRALVKFIAAMGLDLNFVDDPEWEQLIRKSFYPKYQRPSKTTIQNDMIEYYEWKRAELIGQLVEAEQRVALTSDIWSSETSQDYIGVCSHYVDKDWNVEKRLIGFRPIDVGHNGEQIAEQILQVVNDYGISGRVISVTMDNASTNNRAVAILRDTLHPLSDSFFFHSHCVTQILNLVVQDGLMELTSSLQDIRDAITYLNSSHQREEQWRRVCVTNQLASKMIAFDIPVQWNSTYLMLQSIIPYATCFTVWYNGERRQNVLTDRHWDDASMLCKFLEVFYKATNVLSSSSRPTTPFVLHELIVIGDVFKKYRDHGHLEGAVSKMLEKFLKYFYPLPHLYAFALILDPRCRVKGLTKFLKLLGKQLDEDYLSHLEGHKIALQEAYKQYELRFGRTSNVGPVEQMSPAQRSWRLIRAFNQEEESPSSMSPAGAAERNELNLFLDTKFKDTRHDNLDLAKWWRNHSGQYPVLCTLARDIFSIPVSTVSTESAFSLAGNILDPRRSRLKPKMVEILTLLKDWELAQMRMQNTVEEENAELTRRVDEWTLQ